MTRWGLNEGRSIRLWRQPEQGNPLTQVALQLALHEDRPINFVIEQPDPERPFADIQAEWGQ